MLTAAAAGERCIQRLHASISMCGTSQDNEMTHEICMARKLAKAAAELIRHLFHLKKKVWMFIIPLQQPSTGGNGDNFRGAQLFSIFMCLIYVLEPVTGNTG